MAISRRFLPMANSFFNFRQFSVQQQFTAMKVCTDACLFGAWVTATVAEKSQKELHSILDIGSGTGLLSLMLAQKISAQITALEIERNAFLQTVENFTHSPWHERLNAHHVSFLSFDSCKPFDLIVTNPPFYQNCLASPDSGKNTAHHSTALSIAEIFSRSSELLQKDGRLFMLLPFARKTEAEALAKRFGLFLNQCCGVRQTEKHSLFRAMLEFSFVPAAYKESEMVIKNGNNYTEDFAVLLQDYYLRL